MALAQSTTGGNNNSPASATTIDITNFTVSGSNTCLYVALMCNTITAPSPDPTVKWDTAGANQTLTLIKKSTGTSAFTAAYRLINPTGGSLKTISITGLSSSAKDTALAVLFTGVDQTTPEDTVDLVEVGTGNTSVTSSTITSPAGDWIVGFCSCDQNVGSFQNQGHTPVLIQDGSSPINHRIAYDKDTDGANDTMRWTWTTGARGCAISFNLNAASTAATSKKLLLPTNMRANFSRLEGNFQ